MDMTGLHDLGTSELRTEWKRLYRSTPPRLSRDLMIRAIAYRQQEKTHGGLNAATRRKLSAFGTEEKDADRVLPKRSNSARPGARLIREWSGRTYQVTVTEDGYDYDGTVYRSLSQVARVITGARWSGPRFFGLTAKKAPGDVVDGQS